MTFAKLGDRAMGWKILRSQHSKRHILVETAGNLARGESPRRIAVKQDLDHHPRIEWTVAATVTLVASVKTTQVDGLDNLGDEVSQVVFGKPILRRRRQQQTLFRMVGTEGRGHGTILTHANDLLPRRLLER